MEYLIVSSKVKDEMMFYDVNLDIWRLINLCKETDWSSSLVDVAVPALGIVDNAGPSGFTVYVLASVDRNYLTPYTIFTVSSSRIVGSRPEPPQKS